MRSGLLICRLVAALLAVGGPGAAADVYAAGEQLPLVGDMSAVEPSARAVAPVELSVPAAMVRLIERAIGTAPRALALERELALAVSRHRANLGTLETSTGLRARAEARRDSEGGGKGIGASVQWVLRKPMGRSELTFSVGPGVAHRWRSSKLEVAPVVGLTIAHPLGQGPDVRRERADHELRVAVHLYEEERSRLLRDVVQAYGRVQTVAEARDAAWIRLRLETSRLEEMTERTRHGNATPLGLYEAQRRHADALDEWEGAQLALEDAKRSLERLVGASLHDILDPAKDGADADEASPVNTVVCLVLPEGVRAPRTLDEWIRLAQSERVDRALAAEAVALAEAELEGARRKRGWSGEFAARAVYPDPDSFPGDEVRRMVWRIGAELTLPLSDPIGPETEAQAALRLEDARAALELLDARIEADVMTALGQVDRAARRLERARRQLERAAWLVEVAANNVGAGLEPEQALWEARLAHALARRDETEARFDYIQQVLTLWQATERDTTW